MQAPAPASSKAVSNERKVMTFGMRGQKARVVPVDDGAELRGVGRSPVHPNGESFPVAQGKFPEPPPLGRIADAALSAALRPMLGAIMLLPVDRRSYRPLLLGSAMGLTVLVVAGLAYWDAIRESEAALRDLANVQRRARSLWASRSMACAPRGWMMRKYWRRSIRWSAQARRGSSFVDRAIPRCARWRGDRSRLEPPHRSDESPRAHGSDPSRRSGGVRVACPHRHRRNCVCASIRRARTSSPSAAPNINAIGRRGRAAVCFSAWAPPRRWCCCSEAWPCECSARSCCWNESWPSLVCNVGAMSGSSARARPPPSERWRSASLTRSPRRSA